MTGIVFPRHKASLHLTHNDHLSVYETAKDWIEERERSGAVDFVAEGERQRCIDTNEVWHLQWYPNTPVGFCDVAAATLGALLAWVKENCPDAEEVK